MATYLENLIIRRDNIAQTLADITETSDGGGPSYSVEGQTVSHTEYVESLTRQQDQLNALIAQADGGTWEVEMGGL